jgi:hypothetical protein
MTAPVDGLWASIALSSGLVVATIWTYRARNSATVSRFFTAILQHYCESDRKLPVTLGACRKRYAGLVVVRAGDRGYVVATLGRAIVRFGCPMAALVVVAILSAGCSSTEARPASHAPMDDAPTTPSIESTGPTTSEMTPPPSGFLAGAATWPLIDSVPAQLKSGIFIRTGLVYEPELDESLDQARARLDLHSGQAMLAVAPQPAGIAVDEIQLGGFDTTIDDLRAWLFILDSDGALSVFVPDADVADCTSRFSAEQGFADFGLVGDVVGRFAVNSVACRPWAVSEDLTVGRLDSAVDAVNAFGLLLVTEAPDIDDLDPVYVRWLSVAVSTEPLPEATQAISVRVRNPQLALAARTSDTADDATLETLHILGGDGTLHEVAVNEDGTFSLDTSALPERLKLWLDNYGWQQYAVQGPWLDTRRLTRNLEIDLTPEYEIADTNPPPSDRHHRPHELSIWNGGSGVMERQEYRGLNFLNNWGNADRDRLAENPNGCHRAAFFGGSYIEAEQTRVDQKPGVIAEAILAAGADRCAEIFTMGRSLFTVESHYQNVQTLVAEFGITQLIFSISSNELCRMHDDVYVDLNEAALETPLHWRLIGGEMVAPSLRRDAIAQPANDDFSSSEVCSFNTDDDSELDEERFLMSKLDQLATVFAAGNADVRVDYLVTKDAFAAIDDRETRYETLMALCDELATRCHALPLVELYKPEELTAVDYSPFLFRYRDDGHPNPALNQLIAASLVEIVGAAMAAVPESG